MIVNREYAGGVRADAEKRRVPERYLAGVAHEQVKPHGGNAVYPDKDQNAQIVGILNQKGAAEK